MIFNCANTLFLFQTVRDMFCVFFKCCVGTRETRNNLIVVGFQGAGCRWWVPAWWCAATPPRARAGAPLAATTTSPCSCRRPCDPPNLTTTLTLHPPPPPHPYPLTHFHFSSPIQKSNIQCRIAALSISIAPLAHSGMAGSAGSHCRSRG